MKTKSIEQLPTFETLLENLEKTGAVAFAQIKSATAELNQIHAMQEACAAEILRLESDLAALQPVAGVETGMIYLAQRRRLEADLITRRADHEDIAGSLLPLNFAVFEAAREALREPVLAALLAARDLWQKQIDDDLHGIDTRFNEWSEVRRGDNIQRGVYYRITA